VSILVLPAGHAGGAVRGGVHVRAAAGTPLANAMLSALQALGVAQDAFGDSRATLDLAHA